MKQAVGTHEAVLRALERANKKHRRACKVSEIIAAMPPKDVRLLRDSYVKPVPSSVTGILVKFLKKGQIVSPGRSAARCNYNYNYAIPSLFDARQDEVPFIPSRNTRVMELVREAVSHYGRAVRVVDVCRYVDEHGDCHALTSREISGEARKLVRFGKLNPF